MDNIDYKEIMDVLVNDKQTYDVLKRDPTPRTAQTAYTEENREN